MRTRSQIKQKRRQVIEHFSHHNLLSFMLIYLLYINIYLKYIPVMHPSVGAVIETTEKTILTLC